MLLKIFAFCFLVFSKIIAGQMFAGTSFNPALNYAGNILGNNGLYNGMTSNGPLGNGLRGNGLLSNNLASNSLLNVGSANNCLRGSKSLSNVDSNNPRYSLGCNNDGCKHRAASTDGGLSVQSSSSTSSNGLSVLSENAYEGSLNTDGNLPFLGTATVEGNLPSSGAGSVSYGCGEGVIGIESEAPVSTGITTSGGVLAHESLKTVATNAALNSANTNFGNGFSRNFRNNLANNNLIENSESNNFRNKGLSGRNLHSNGFGSNGLPSNFGNGLLKNSLLNSNLANIDNGFMGLSSNLISNGVANSDFVSQVGRNLLENCKGNNIGNAGYDSFSGNNNLNSLCAVNNNRAVKNFNNGFKRSNEVINGI